MSHFKLTLFVPLVLAACIMPLFISVNGEMCGAMTLADTVDDYASLLKKAIFNFRSTCRNSPKQDIDKCVLGSHTCDVLNHETCVNAPGGFECVCMVGYQLNGGSCNACRFSTVPHPKPYSYAFILEPQMSPFTVNFIVKTEVAALVGLSEHRTDQSIVIEILFGYCPGTKIIVRACMPHLCPTTGDGSPYGEYQDTSPVTSNTEYRPFWIHYNEGVVTAGKGGQQENLVEWDAGAYHGRVPTQLHIGISTWEKGYGEWDFCQ